MDDWQIPASADEFFSQGPNQYSIIDRDYPGDNNFGMQLFIESVGLESFCTLDDGTYCEFTKDGVTLGVHSGGLGDFHMHGFDVETP